MYGIVKMIVKETTKNSVEDFEVRFYDLNYDLSFNLVIWSFVLSTWVS